MTLLLIRTNPLEGGSLTLPQWLSLEPYHNGQALFKILTLPLFISLSMSSNQRRQWHPTPVLLPGKSHGRRSLEGCSPWGRWGSDTTEWLHFHFSLSCIGEGHGNPLQWSCLENPRDDGAWWAAIYGITQSQTWLKWLSSMSSNKNSFPVFMKWRTFNQLKHHCIKGFQ